MADAKYPRAAATFSASDADAIFLTPAEGDAAFLTPTEGNAAYVRRNGIAILNVGTSTPSSPGVGDGWVDTN